jgi:hypothetical protein
LRSREETAVWEEERPEVRSSASVWKRVRCGDLAPAATRRRGTREVIAGGERRCVRLGGGDGIGRGQWRGAAQFEEGDCQGGKYVVRLCLEET